MENNTWFLRLTADDGNQVVINVAAIDAISPGLLGGTTRITLRCGKSWCIEGSVDTLADCLSRGGVRVC